MISSVPSIRFFHSHVVDAFGRQHLVAVLAFAAVVLSGPTGASHAADPSFTIAREGEGLVIQADDADVEEIASALGKRLGFEVSVLTGAERPPVNGRIAGESASEILQKVLRDRNYALVYESSGEQDLSRVLILSPPPERRWVPPPPPSQSREDQVRAALLRKRRLQAQRDRRARSRRSSSR